MTTPSTFPLFAHLPLELRLRIFSFAVNSNPRTIDIWSTHTTRTIEHTTFYTQKYLSLLASLTPHPLLHATHESRSEARRYYSLEFETSFPHPDIEHVEPAKWYLNWATDVLVPRGYWNVCAFADLIRRGWGKWRRLGIDVGGSFWRDGVKDAVASGEWIFEGLDEILLFNSNDDAFWKEESVEEFRESWDGRGRELVFVNGVDEKRVRDSEGLLKGYFERLSGKGSDAEFVEDDGLEEADIMASFSSTAETVVVQGEGKDKEASLEDDDATEIEFGVLTKVPKIRVTELVVLPVGGSTS